MRLDSLLNLKWATWYYDSIGDRHILDGAGIINSVKEADNGNILCAVGDEYPYPLKDINKMNNYAALMIVDSLGKNPYLPGEAGYVKEYDNQTGYNIEGFYIDENSNHRYIMSGNRYVYYTDSFGNAVSQAKYTFWLDGVGTMENDVCRAKVLRDGTVVVAGRAYERNCWKTYKTLYYDAWWSPLTGGGGNVTWDTAGIQGRDDLLYDFTQLKNGNLVFVGTRGNTTTDSGGIWAFVTDSSGKKLLWQKQQTIQYKNDPAKGRAVVAYSVCATDDGGFTAVGEELGLDSAGGENGLVAHFIPKPKSAVVSRGNFLSKSMNGFNIHVAGAKLVVNNNSAIKNNCEAMLFNLTGKQIAARTGEKEMVFDISHLSYGTYVVKMKAGSVVHTMKIAKE